MKTRSNMPLFVLECDNVKTLSNSQIDLLRCGDYLVKKDASGEHAYKVTFKSETGMCLTYHDASVIETQSYDFVDGNWVYNSEDKTPNLLEVAELDDIKPIYWHGIICDKLGISDIVNSFTFHILKNDNTPINTLALLKAWFESIDGEVTVQCNGNVYYDSKNYDITLIQKTTEFGYVLRMRNDSDGVVQLVNVDLEDYIGTMFDDVNKIN